MEFYLCRALEAGRLSHEDMIRLHIKEKNIGRALQPFEIHNTFHLCPLKEQYSIPHHEVAQAEYNQSIRVQLARAGLAPGHDFSMTDLEEIHKFDEKISEAATRLNVDFTYRSSSGVRRNRVSDEMDEPNKPSELPF